MNKYHIVITETAENELASIGRYIAKELLEPNVAQKLLDKIGEEIMTLQELPFRYSLVIDEGLAQKGIRKIVIDKFIVFYVITEHEKVVTIIRILYGRRDWMNIL